MNKGGYRKAVAGFTIVETLIVLAVTGLLFVIAAVAISGRQNQTAFQTSINDLHQQIQQIISETAAGYYPTTNFQCQAVAPSVKVVIGSAEQGTNGNCLFLGKVLQFGTNADHTQLVAMPITGLRGTNLTVQSTHPIAIYPNGVNSQVDASERFQMENGLEVAKNGAAFRMYYNGTNVTGAIGFLVGDKTGTFATPGTGGLTSGAQQLSLWAVQTTTPDSDPLNTANAIDTTGNLIPVTSASICIASSTTNQSGLFNIDSGLNVTLTIKTGLIC